MEILNKITNLFGGGSSEALKTQAQPAQANTAQAQQQNPEHNPEYNRGIAASLLQAPTKAHAKPAPQAPQGPGAETIIKSLFSSLFQKAPQNALNLLVQLMGPFMEMSNGSTPTQPAVLASSTPQAGPAPQPDQAFTNPNLLSLIGQLGLGAGQAESAQAQIVQTGQATPAETNYDALLKEAISSALSSEQPAPAAATPAPATPTVQLAPKPNNSQPAQTNTYHQGA